MSDNSTPHSANVPMRRFDEESNYSSSLSRGPVRSPRPANSAPQQLSPKFFWWVFTRSWALVLPTGVILAACVAAALLYSYVPVYRATGLIRIEDTQPYIAFQGATVGSTNSAFVRTQVELMRSPIVLREVLSDDRVGSASHLLEVDDRLKHLRSKVSIKRIGGSELYEVSYVSPVPQESSDVVAAVISRYFARQSDEKFRQVQRVVDLLETERARRQVEVERLQGQVIALSKAVTGKDPFGHNTITDVDRATSPLASLHRELTDIEVQIEILSAELQSLEESQVVSTPHIDRSNVIDLEVGMASEVRQREQAIVQLQDQMREYQRVSKRYASNSNYLRLAEQLGRAEAELLDYKSKLRRKLLLAKSRSRSGGLSPVEEKRKTIEGLKLRQRTLQNRFQIELANVQEGGGKGAELEFAKAELDREEKVFQMIAARKLALQTETNAPARVTAMDKVTASSAPVESAPWKKLGLACSLAMVAPFGLAVVRELALRRVSDAEQLHEDTSLRVVGEVANFPGRSVAANPARFSRKTRTEMYAFAESIDALRMAFTYLAPSHETRVIALTSAVSGEGKTSVSSGLAVSFANATSSKTLLIDGDMRDPGVHKLLEVDPGPGLTDYLAGKSQLHEVIRPAKGVPNLFILQAGKSELDPHRLADPAKLAAMVAAARNEFATIVIDTPPVLGASEALSLCRSADMTALCAMRGVSRGRQMKIVTDKLETAGATIAGAVLSGVPTRGYGYLYAYGYGRSAQTGDRLFASS